MSYPLMIKKLRNFLLNEIFFMMISAIVILLLVVARGIFFDEWYSDWKNMGLAGGGIYMVTILYRLFFRPRKSRDR